MPTIPKEEIPITNEVVYSNYDNVLEQEVVEILKSKPNEFCSQHAAWNFCGYIWYDGRRWKEEIWVNHYLQEVLEADTIEDLIEEANSKYGSG